MILAVVCDLPVENRFRINLLDPQTTVLTLDLHIVVRIARGGKPVPTHVLRAIHQEEECLLFVGHWLRWIVCSEFLAPWSPGPGLVISA